MIWQYCQWFAAWIVLGTSVCAEPVWHCSRSPAQGLSINSRNDPSDMCLPAEMGVIDDVIRISLGDLIDAYSGLSVRLSGIPLSACFMPVNDPLTTKTLRALGLSQEVLSALARKSAIAGNHLYRVTDEDEMKTCISRNQPAVGYLSQAQSNEKLAPCF